MRHLFASLLLSGAVLSCAPQLDGTVCTDDGCRVDSDLVILNDQADVDAMTDVVAVSGDLTIAARDGATLDLTPLASLREVGGDLTLSAGADRLPLPALTSAGSIRAGLDGAAPLEAVEVPSLVEADLIFVRTTTMTWSTSARVREARLHGIEGTLSVPDAEVLILRDTAITAIEGAAPRLDQLDVDTDATLADLGPLRYAATVTGISFNRVPALPLCQISYLSIISAAAFLCNFTDPIDCGADVDATCDDLVEGATCMPNHGCGDGLFCGDPACTDAPEDCVDIAGVCRR